MKAVRRSILEYSGKGKGVSSILDNTSELPTLKTVSLYVDENGVHSFKKSEKRKHELLEEIAQKRLELRNLPPVVLPMYFKPGYAISEGDKQAILRLLWVEQVRKKTAEAVNTLENINLAFDFVEHIIARQKRIKKQTV